LHEKKHPVNSKKVQSRINPKSTEKCGKTRWQMKKLFETEIVSHWWPSSWKLICIANWNDWNTGNWACDALTQTRRQRKQENTGKTRIKQKIRDLRHLTFQVSVIICRSYIAPLP
jgi:hypothetical protein